MSSGWQTCDCMHTKLKNYTFLIFRKLKGKYKVSTVNTMQMYLDTFFEQFSILIY